MPELHFEYSSFGDVFQRESNIISYISFQHFETDNFVLSVTKKIYIEDPAIRGPKTTTEPQHTE